MNYKYELSIVMPCLNEAETLESCLKKALTFLEKHKINGEIIVGDNGSTDGSLEIAGRLGVKIVKVPIKGYGAALMYAIRESEGKYIIMGDSDDSYDFSNLINFVEKLREGYELVMGNRFLGGIKPGAMPWKNKWIGNPVLTGIGKVFFNSPASDFHCGLRGFSKEGFDKLGLRGTGMEFASEMVIKASLLSLKVTEVSTTLSPDGRSRPPHLRPWRDGWRHLRLMLLFSPRWLFLFPGVISILVGLILGTRIFLGTLEIGSFKFDINTLIYSGAFILIGFQSVAFAIFTKVFAIQEGLMPSDARLNHLFEYITLETGLIIGCLLLIFGFWGLGIGLSVWKEAGFAEMNPLMSVRIAYPSAVAIILGFQVIFSSFFMSVLGLKLDRK